MVGGENDKTRSEPGTPVQDNRLDRDLDLNEGTMLRRSRKRRTIFFVALLSAAVVLLIVWPIVSEQLRSPSQKLILTARDLGPGWWDYKPESINSQSPGATDSALVRMMYDNGTSHFNGTCILTFFSNLEFANAAYQSEHERLSADKLQYTSLENVTEGDRAVVAASSIDGHEGWQKQLIMQKGSSIVWITLYTTVGPGIETAQMLDLAEIQAAKLP